MSREFNSPSWRQRIATAMETRPWAPATGLACAAKLGTLPLNVLRADAGAVAGNATAAIDAAATTTVTSFPAPTFTAASQSQFYHRGDGR